MTGAARLVAGLETAGVTLAASVPDTWIGRLIGADREIAFLHGLLNGSSEIRHSSDLLLIDFLNDGTNLDPCIIRA